MPVRRSRKGAPGLVEVAARANVSPATVSRYFNDPAVVKPATKARIAKAAAELGYIRDRMAGAMHSRFSGTFGMIVPTIDNAIFSELIEAFAARLMQADRTMLIASHGYDLSLETVIVRSLLERRIDGVCVIGFDHAPIPLEMLEQRGVPVISAWNYRKDADLPCVGTDNYDVGMQAAHHLIDLDHRDIACVFPETETNDRARDRLAGARAAMAAVGVHISAHRLRIAPYDIGAAKAVGLDLLEENPPTAVICGNDVIAQGIVYACLARGVTIPDDLSIVGIGDFRGSAHMEPGLTTLRLPARSIGEAAADTLLTMSRSGLPPDNPHRNIDATLIERGSTRRL